MDEKEFELKGTITAKGKEKKFAKTVNAKSKNHAIHKTKSLFGSKNKLKRHEISIMEVKEIAQRK